MKDIKQNTDKDDNFDVVPYEDHPLSDKLRYMGQAQERDAHLRDYIAVLLRRKWVFLGFLITVVVTVSAYTLTTIPEYKSTVVIKIDKENPNILSFKDVNIERLDSDYYETQYEILKSRNLARRVIRKENLDKNRDFIMPSSELAAIKGSFFSFLNSFVDKTKDAEGSPEMKQADVEVKSKYVNSLLNRLEITPVKNSRLVKATFTASTPELSQSVVNAIADEYIDFNIESKMKASKEAKVFLEKQIQVIKAKLEGSEGVLNDYSSRKGIIYLDDNRASESLMTKRLSEISSSLSQATADRIAKESVYKETMQPDSQHPSIIDNPLIKSFKERFAVLEAEYHNLLKIYTPEFPKMKSLKAQMETINDRIEKERSNIVKSVESDYFAAVKRESYLKSAYEASKKNTLKFQEQTVQYQILKRDVDADREMYNSLLQRLKEVGVAATQATTNIQILDRAEYPKRPFKPNFPRNFLLSVIVGFVGGIGLVFFQEYYDNTVKGTQEIEKWFQIPTLGMVPHLKSVGLYKKLAKGNGKSAIAWTGSNEPIADAFRSIGTFISLSSIKNPPKTILVTSAGEKEGKTTVCINTAAALLESMSKGIIIDADLRMPKLHSAFELSNEKGLSTFLSGNVEFSEDLIRETGINGLDVITSGPQCPNPSKLIRSERFKVLLDILQKSYNFIIIDSAPLVSIPDSIYLSSVVDGTVLVVRAGKTSVQELAEVKRIFHNINARLIGVILNAVRDSRHGYYYSYYKDFNKRMASDG